MRIRPAAIPPILLAGALMAPGACGAGSKSDTGKFSGTEKDVAQAVYDLRDAIVSRDEGKICDSFVTATLRKRLDAEAEASKRGSSCSDELKESIATIDSTDITVETVTVHGDTARVTIKTKLRNDPDPIDVLYLKNERGWRLSSL